MIEVILILISWACKKAFALLFFIHGCVVASFRLELRQYLREIAVIDDVYLGVTGQYFLNATMRKGGYKFGNRLLTISATIFLTDLSKFGKFWNLFLNKLEKDHAKNAYLNAKELMKKTLNET